MRHPKNEGEFSVDDQRVSMSEYQEKLVTHLSDEPVVDVKLQHEGTICLFHLLTRTAKDWVDENVEQHDLQTWGSDAIVVGHRYVGDIVDGMHRNGLEVR